jgi:hypothetical protein
MVTKQQAITERHFKLCYMPLTGSKESQLVRMPKPEKLEGKWQMQNLEN